jgi:hypothetical protein
MRRAESENTEPEADQTLVDSPVVSEVPARLARAGSKLGSQQRLAESASPAPPLLRKTSSSVDRKRKAPDASEADAKHAKNQDDAKKEQEKTIDEKPAAAAADGAKKNPDEERDAKAAFESMESDLTCSICQEIYYRCVSVLPCLHNFCAPCYGAWAKRSKQVCCT